MDIENGHPPDRDTTRSASSVSTGHSYTFAPNPSLDVGFDASLLVVGNARIGDGHICPQSIRALTLCGTSCLIPVSDITKVKPVDARRRTEFPAGASVLAALNTIRISVCHCIKSLKLPKMLARGFLGRPEITRRAGPARAAPGCGLVGTVLRRCVILPVFSRDYRGCFGAPVFLWVARN